MNVGQLFKMFTCCDMKYQAAHYGIFLKI